MTNLHHGAGQRLAVLDYARGGAVIAMIAYHFCWDLWAFNLIDADLLADGFWLAARTAIISVFLFVAGICAMAPGDVAGLRRRFIRLTAAAAVVSAATYAVFPDTWVFFGVLHHLAVAGLLAAGLRRVVPPLALAVLGGLVIGAGVTQGFDLLNTPWLYWVGMGSITPASNDYVPLFPWFGVVLLGMAAGPTVLRFAVALPYPAAGGLARLAWAGRWSLIIYLLHQPLLYGGVWGWTLLAGQGPMGTRAERDFIASCQQSCIAGGVAADSCLQSCLCARDGLQAADLWRPLLSGGLTPAQHERLQALVQTCNPSK